MKFQSRYVYDLGVQGLLNRALRERDRRQIWRKNLILVSILLALMVVNLWVQKGGALFESPSSEPWAIYLVVPILLLLLYLPILLGQIWRHKQVQRLLFETNPDAGQEVEHEIDDDGITYRSARIVSKISWSAIRVITNLRDNSAVVLWSGPRHGIILPAASFVPPESFKAACAFMKEKCHVPA